MRLTLVFPNIGSKNRRRYRPMGRMEPLALGVIAALTPPDVEVRLYDDRIEDVPFDEPTDLVGISVETFTARRAYEIAARYRSRGVRVVLGGVHPSMAPEEALRHADAIVVGEAEGLWPTLVADARAGRLARRYERTSQADLAGVVPRRDIFRGKRYLDVRLSYPSRGCRYGCNFCALASYYRPPFNVRPPEEVAAEVATLGRSFVLFVDDNMGCDRAAAERLFELLIPLGVRWATQISINFLEDERFVALMARSGCKGLLVGIESLDAGNLAAMNKGVNLERSYGRAFRNLERHGIMHWSSFVFGYDGDDEGIFERSAAYATELGSCLAAFNPLTPYPNTALYELLRREGRLLLEDWWIHPEYRFGQIPFTPRSMSAGELEEGCRRARRRFYGLRSIARRALRRRTHLASLRNALFFAGANFISWRDAMAKQRMQFGSEG